MFSSSSSSGGGCGCGGGNNGGSGDNIWNSGLKKPAQKRPKVPKRGPGVAELEKILREQEKTSNNNGEGFSVSSLRPHCSPPPSPSSPPQVMSSGRIPPPHLQPAVTPPPPPMYGGYNGNFTTSTTMGGRNKNNGMGYNGEQALFPMNLSSCDGLTQSSLSDHSGNSSSKNLCSESSNNNINPFWSSTSYPPAPALPHTHTRHSNTITNNTNNQYQQQHAMMKQILGNGAQTSSTTIGIGQDNNHLDLPSNQITYFNCMMPRNPEEYKVQVGMKRPHSSSSFDNSNMVPPTHYQVPPMFPNNNLTRQHKSSTNDHNNNHLMTATNFTSSNNDFYYRDAKRGSPLGYNNYRKFNCEDKGQAHPNFSSFNCPPTSLPSPPIHMFQRELCKTTTLPYQVTTQERTEESYQRSESLSGSDHRPFYSFLETKEVGMKESILVSNHVTCDLGSDEVDLTLKL